MKVRTVVLSSLAGMLLSASAVYLFPAPAGHAAAPPPPPPTVPEENPPIGPASTFSDGSTLHVDGRLGHARLAKGSRGDTYLLLEVRGGDGARAAPPPSHLAIVIDR